MYCIIPYIHLLWLNVSLQEGRQDHEIAKRTENAWRGYWPMKELMNGPSIGTEA